MYVCVCDFNQPRTVMEGWKLFKYLYKNHSYPVDEVNSSWSMTEMNKLNLIESPSELLKFFLVLGNNLSMYCCISVQTLIFFLYTNKGCNKLFYNSLTRNEW